MTTKSPLTDLLISTILWFIAAGVFGLAMFAPDMGFKLLAWGITALTAANMVRSLHRFLS